MARKWDPKQGHDVIDRRVLDAQLDKLKQFLIRRLNRQQAEIVALREQLKK